MIGFRILIFVTLGLISCLHENEDYANVDIRKIEIEGKINDPDAEISAMDWYNDQLILMPEKPEYFSGNQCYRLAKSEIIDFLDTPDSSPLKISAVDINADFSGIINGIEGYEAIAFSGDTIFAAVEAKNGSQMNSWLVKGKINATMNVIEFDTARVVKIPAPEEISNFAVETILIHNNEVLCIYEANGFNVNPGAAVYRFSKDLKYLGILSFPNIEYRITDATRATGDIFWVVNTYYTGEAEKLNIAPEKFNPVTTTIKENHMERLVKMRIKEDKIEIADFNPLMIIPDPQVVRNWEGIVRLDDRGFLLVNDKFPRKSGTILAFIAFKN